MTDWMIPANWTNSVTQDFIYLFKGEVIGAGLDRTVFEMKGDKTKVIKVEHGSQRFQNVMEYRTWANLLDTPYKKWLAPCLAIAEMGSILIQARTTPLTNTDELPQQIPAWLSDYKLSNYGWLATGRRRQFVCHDYGVNLLLNNGAYDAKPQMRKTKPEEWTD